MGCITQYVDAPSGKLDAVAEFLIRMWNISASDQRHDKERPAFHSDWIGNPLIRLKASDFFNPLDRPCLIEESNGQDIRIARTIVVYSQCYRVMRLRRDFEPNTMGVFPEREVERDQRNRNSDEWNPVFELNDQSPLGKSVAAASMRMPETAQILKI